MHFHCVILYSPVCCLSLPAVSCDLISEINMETVKLPRNNTNTYTSLSFLHLVAMVT